MWLYYLLKTISTLVSWLPYKLVVNIGIGIGHLYHTIAKKQRIRAEETIKERLGYSDEEAKCTIKSLFVKLGITFMEIMYMPALNKDNIRGLVTFDRPDVLWEALNEGHGVVMLACHMDNWEWLGSGNPDTLISDISIPFGHRGVYAGWRAELSASATHVKKGDPHQAGYTIHSFSLSYKPVSVKGFEASVTLDNAFNKLAMNGKGVPLSGRTVSLYTRYQW